MAHRRPGKRCARWRRKTKLEKDARYCSWGDTVHYADPPKVFASCDGSYLYDDDNTPYLDLQMWCSAVNFGYKNRRLNEVLKRQIDTLPQLACQYLHKGKVELAETICSYIEEKYGVKGRVHFNGHNLRAGSAAHDSGA